MSDEQTVTGSVTTSISTRPGDQRIGLYATSRDVTAGETAADDMAYLSPFLALKLAHHLIEAVMTLQRRDNA